MDDLETLEQLSLVAKVVSELENHIGDCLSGDNKTVAEFIIDQRCKCASFDEFKDKLSAVGADFPASLVESIDRLVTSMHPSMKGRNQQKGTYQEAETQGGRSAEEKSKVFRGLTLPDMEVPNEPDAIDDTLAMLEKLERKKNGTSRTSRKRSRSPEADDKIRRRKERNRSRSRSQARGRHGHRRYSDDKLQRPATDLDDSPILNKIYDGHVTGIKDFGAFVNIHGIKGRMDGLVHISAFGQRIDHPADMVQAGQSLKVKVIKIEGSRIGLSVKDVDQETGQDLAPQPRLCSGANMEALGGRGRGAVAEASMESFQKSVAARQHKKRMTSPERWEIRQMIAAGIAKASDYPNLEEEYQATLKGEGQMDLEEDIDIEVRDEEPPFLAGQTRQSLELSPIRVVKAPGGSMNRAAMAGTNLAKERKDLRQQEVEATEKERQELKKVDLVSQWQDPMADPEQRRFAADLRKKAQASARPENDQSWKKAVLSKDQAMGKRTNLTIREQRESLPVYAFRDQLIKAVKENQILIVIGETGSGKTTQLTQYLAEGGFTNDGIIGCTQPRRVAAVSVAKRVAEEVGCQLGQEVGYTIRFEDVTSPATKIKYMTDGMLNREIVRDPNLTRYSVIMLDEAHERTLDTDVVLALLKKTVKRRPDLKVIVTSATLNADKFSEYFNAAPIFTIPGRTFPVEVLYSREPESDYLDAALTTVMQIHLSEPMGDILVFLTGQEEIDTSCEILFERMKALGPNVPDLLILPVYSALPSEMQSRIFEPAPPGSRKVVIATNIAETSITIDGIYYVVDPGFVKQNVYDPKLGMDSLIITPISQAQANQRAGRAGRTGPGKAFRLYTENAFQNEMLPTTTPEIQRQNLSNTILMLKAMGINDLLGFDFMDPPPVNTMLTALEELYALAAIDDDGLLTRLGRKMADFPMDPSQAKVLIKSTDYGCADEVLSIIAMLSIQSPFYRPKDKQNQADQKKAKFHDSHGDHMTFLNVYKAWKNSGYSISWCQENFIQARLMRRVQDVRTQLARIMERHRHKIESCGRDSDKVRRALCSGFFRNTARKDQQEGYKTLIEGTPVYLHPSSALFQKQAEWVIYHTLVLTTREYMHCTTAIEPKWLVEAAPTFFRVAPTDKLSKRKRQERIQPLYNKFLTEEDWRLSAQKRGGRAGGGGGTWG